MKVRSWTIAACLLATAGLIVGATSASAGGRIVDRAAGSSVDLSAPLIPDDTPGGPPGGSRVTDAPSINSPHASAAVTGGASALVITVALYATSTTPKTVPDVTAAQVAHDVVEGTRPFFQHNSHGVFAGFFALSRGPVSVRTTQTPCSSGWLKEIGDQADAGVTLHEPALNINSFNAVIYYFGNVAACSSYAGWGNTPDQGRRVWLNGDHTARTATHELGHNLNLGHSASQRCTTSNGVPVPLSDNCTTDEYGDLLSAMGGTWGLTDGYAPDQLAQLGWNQSRTATVSAGDPATTIFLTPEEVDAPVGAIQTIRLFDGANFLWLDFHQGATGASSGFTTYTTGLLVRREMNPLAISPALLFMNQNESSGNIGTIVHPNMFAGQSWTDPLGTVTITLNSASDAGASVTIQSPPPPPPTDRIVPNVVGEQLVSANAAVRAVDLVGVPHRRAAANCEDLSMVISQSPAAGTHVPPGYHIDYTYNGAPSRGCGIPN